MPSAGLRTAAKIREKGLCTDPTDAVSFLWKGDPGRHVSSCGPATSGLGAAVAVPNRLVHYLEGIPPGLSGTCEEWP